MSNTIAWNERTVGELAVEMPESIRVFEAWKIDYCCGGGTSLAKAVEAAGKSVDQFVAELESLSSLPGASVDWPSLGLSAMATQIVAGFHGSTREELQTVEPLAVKVLSVHGERRPELAVVVSLIRELRDDMLPHMLKEEQILFPYVEQMEQAEHGHRAAPTPFFGTVKNPIRMMMLEHDRVGELLSKLREVSQDYTPPESACFSYRELYRRLEEFETMTHEHIHIENNLFFPRAVEMEDRVGAPAEMSGCSH
ncbi:MAG TPA: iron-sulfur cluster repair di-iron protein [Thermoanaerobaculia bacterium]|nr:iron-sulfur cluster repair di-iron protein [Thermoanaerobaculia bacterium]